VCGLWDWWCSCGISIIKFISVRLVGSLEFHNIKDNYEMGAPAPLLISILSIEDGRQIDSKDAATKG
jgi:hypothetical protein